MGWMVPDQEARESGWDATQGAQEGWNCPAGDRPSQVVGHDVQGEFAPHPGQAAAAEARQGPVAVPATVNAAPAALQALAIAAASLGVGRRLRAPLLFRGVFPL